MKQIHTISAGFSCMIIAGMTLDGWAHAHGATDNTFFTPWHAILYAGLLGSTVWYGWLTRHNIAPLHIHRIGFALLPIVVVCAGADLTWHTLFGFEIDIAAQMSPPHIVLAGVIATLVCLPSFQRDHNGHITYWGALSGGLAATMMLTLTQFMSPLSAVYAEQYAGGDTTRGLGITGFIIFVAVWVLVLLWMRRNAAPRGAFALASLALAVTQASISDDWRFIVLMVVCGLVADMRWPLGNVPHRIPAMMWTLCFGMGYFLQLKYLSLLAWSPAVWGGAVVMALAVTYGVTALQPIHAAQGAQS